MKKILLSLLGFAIVLTSFGQGVDVGKKCIIRYRDIPEQLPPDMLVAGDKTGLVALAAYVLADEGSGLRVDHMINTALAGTKVYFVFEYTALTSTKIRLHFIWIGPTYNTVNFSDWRSVSPTTYGQASVSFSGSMPLSTGTYKLIVYAEQEKPFSGAESVAECQFRLF